MGDAAGQHGRAGRSVLKGHKHTENARNQTRAFFYFFCKKLLDIPQKCGIMIIQKKHSKQTETKQEENRMTYIIEMNINGTWKRWNTYDNEENCKAGYQIARNYGEVRIITKEGK